MKYLKLLLISLLFPAAVQAKGWDDALYKQIEQSIQQPTFADKEYLITKYGAKVDATAAANQKAIQKAIDLCAKKGGGKVIIPAGTFNTGAIRIKTGVNLVIEKDAVLQFVFEPELYPVVPTRWEGLDCWNISPCIYAYQEKNIAVTGEGTIDGGGNNDTWWPWCGAPHFGWKEGMISQRSSRPQLLKMAEDGVPMNERRFTKEDGLRPQLVSFYQCENILIEGVKMLRSPFWVMHPVLCKNTTVRNVTVINDGPNGDGCDPESCDGVLIENCYFSTGDDCIAVKSGRNADARLWNKPSENIIIRGCEMKNGHGGVVIGSEIGGGCRNLFAENNVMDSPELDRVIRIKTNTCRGGVTENIFVRNIEVGECKESVLKINLDYDPREVCCRGYIPTVRNINLENVTCKKSKYGVMIVALDTCTNVYDINVKNCNFTGVADGNYIKGKTRDINFDNLYINGQLSLVEAPYKNFSQWMTMSEIKRVPKSYLLDFSKRPKWSYVMGIELEAMLDTYLKYGDETIRKYCQEYVDTMINAEGVIRSYNLKDYNIDHCRTGHFVARMWDQYGEEKNLIALKTLLKQMEDQGRTSEGVFWHKDIYAYQVWLDGIFMGLPVRTLTTTLMAQKGLMKQKKVNKLYDDAVNQIKITYDRTLDPKTGLNRHAWDETREMFWSDDVTGQSQHCWARAQGWYTMALVELLDAMPEDYARRGEIQEVMKKVFDAIIKWQDKETGVWYQVMDSPKREGNYLESTATSMFAYSMLKAYRKGYVTEKKYQDAGITAYKGILKQFIKVNPDETISLTNCCAVSGLGPGSGPTIEAYFKKVKKTLKPNTRRDGSYAYYLSEPVRDNDAKGVGPFIWASLEMEELGYNTSNVQMPINRGAVVSRNNPLVTEANALASLSVGNGHFATTVDVTGLQSFPFDYEAGVPLTAMSDWGWHSFKNTDGLTEAETQKSFDFGHGHKEVYAVEYKKGGGRQQAATSYFRVNPHRLNLGTIGLEFKDKQGNVISLKDIKDIRQELQLWYGKIESSYTVDGTPVNVITGCLQDADALFARIRTDLLEEQRAAVTIKFSYPSGKHADDGNDWTKPDLHSSKIIATTANSAVIERIIDATTYYVKLQWEGQATITETGKHCFALKTDEDILSFCAEYTEKREGMTKTYEFDQYHKAIVKAWPKFWNSCAIVDFSECTDPRAKELERRVVLSQYLTQINCANSTPPQETGLTYNSWFGRPHLEMTWWHMVDFSLWGRPKTLATILDWYNDVAFPEAQKIAARQGFKGARWMKMTDPNAGEAPSNTGSFLTWQQPHYIYMAEEMYRHNPSKKTLKKYAKQVEETAVFMADFAQKSAKPGQPIKLFGQTAMQEGMTKDFSFNHPFEQAYWYYGLSMAQTWRERQGLERHAEWDDIISRIAPLAEKDGIYQAGEPIKPFDSTVKGSEFDPFVSAPQEGRKEISEEDYLLHSRSDHPAVLGACGLLPATPLYDADKMRETLKWVMKNWNWEKTWGWDYGMVAMCAARLGETEIALDALLIDKVKNTYLVSGHNFQTADRLRLYLPGNGALLDAVAMMCAGWDGCKIVRNPGFPKDGKWNVRWEGLHKMQ